MDVILNQGWQCPKCLKIWAPHIAACAACNARQVLPFDQVPVRPPYIGTPQWGNDYVPRFTCEQPEWNFNGDDLSYT